MLLDNFDLDEMRAAVAVRDELAPRCRARGERRTHARGGPAVGETGVDYIAVGELTHSAPVLDLGLDLEDVLA